MRVAEVVLWLVAAASCIWLALALLRVRALRAALREVETRFPEGERARALERELLLHTLLDAAPSAVMFFSDAGRIVFANAAARELFFEGEAAEGKNFLAIAASGPAAFRSALLAQGDRLACFEVEGSREHYQLTRRVFPFAGELHTLLVVRHVTREVARQELDLLKRVVRLLSHEVNNALAPISSLVHSARQILKSGDRTERLEKAFATIDGRAQHLAQFISGYATLARLPAPTPREQRWEPLVARLCALYPGVQPLVAAEAQGFFDAGQIEQALINLLKNAQEAGGPPESVTLSVRAVSGASEIEVADRGVGFSPDALESAVLPFFTTKPGGSGVGLALVREIVEAHGGHLRLGARDGGGALVSLQIPDSPNSNLSVTRRARLTLTRR